MANETPSEVKVLTVITSNKIAGHELPAFRGAVCRAARDNSIFHNHVDSGLRYSYPLIQYKRVGGVGVLWGLNEGFSALESLVASMRVPLNISGRTEMLSVAEAWAEECDVTVGDECFNYHLVFWIPLNQENHKQYVQCESIIEKLQLLQRVLTGNILSFLKGIGCFVDKPIECRITNYKELRPAKYKGVKMNAFDLDFVANVRLPQLTGLGHGVSVGFGSVTRKE